MSCTTPLLGVDLNAQQYSEHSKLQKHSADDIINRIQFTAKKEVFDIGCGTGGPTASLAQKMKQAKVTGIDISPSMIQHAQQHFPQCLYPNLTFTLGNIENVFLPNRPDLVTSFSAFHWVRKPEETLTKLCQSLLPDGDLVILTYLNSGYYDFLQNTLVANFPQYQHQSAYHTMFSFNDYKCVIANCGLKIEELKVENLTAIHDNETEMKEFIRGWLTSFVPIPEGLHEAFLNAAVEESKSYRLPSSDNKIHLPYKKLTLRAKKEISEDCCRFKCTIL